MSPAQDERSRPSKLPGENAEPGTRDIDQAPESNETYDEKPGFSHQEIEYLYLNFDTSLPHPVGVSSPQEQREGQPQSPVPQCPDLKEYSSPFLWPKARKSVVTLVSCCVTAMAAYAAGEYSPPSKELMAKWGISKVAYNVGITLFTLGFGIAPMVLAPFSEINGRRPIFVLSGLLFTGWLISFFWLPIEVAD